jgi:hypothetical protein
VWLQGSSATHVFIWLEGEIVEKVNVEMDGLTESFHRFQVISEISPSQRRALLVLSQIDKPGTNMKDFLKSLGIGVSQ